MNFTDRKNLIGKFYRSNFFAQKQRQNFLPIKFKTKRQTTSLLIFLMIFCPDMFFYLTFGFSLFKTSKILIFGDR